MNASLPTGRVGHILAIGLLLLLLAIIWTAVASPLIGWYQARAETLSQQTMFAQRMSMLASELPALDQTARRTAKSAPARNALLRGATDAIAGAVLQQRLQNMATQSGATLSSAETLAAQKDGVYQRIRLRVAVTGSWPVLVHLLRAVTTSVPSMLVDNLRLTGSDLLVHQASEPLNAMFTVIAFRAGTVHPGASKAGTGSVTEQ